MHVRCKFFAIALLCVVASPVAADIMVSSYTTVAETNAYAPLSRAVYFATDEKPNTSLAVADVSADWSGTNLGGTELTWWMIAEAHSETSTNFDAQSLTVTGTGSFGYEITTTEGFVDPSRSATLYTPAAASDYQCYFTLDAPATYQLDALLNRWSLVYFASFQAGVIFQQSNSGILPRLIDQSGVIPPGQYEIRVNASLSGPSPLADGVNQVSRSGSFNDFNFFVEVPEPHSIIVIAGAVILTRRIRKIS